jgi:hypothetical protein
VSVATDDFPVLFWSYFETGKVVYMLYVTYGNLNMEFDCFLENSLILILNPSKKGFNFLPSFESFTKDFIYLNNDE